MINLCSSVLWFSYGLLVINAMIVWLPNLIGIVIIFFELLLCVLFPPTHHMERTAIEKRRNTIVVPLKEAQSITSTINKNKNSMKNENQNDRMLNEIITDYSSTENDSDDDDFYPYDRKPSMIFATFQNSRQLLPGMRDLQGFSPTKIMVGFSPPSSPSVSVMNRMVLPNSSPDRLVSIKETTDQYTKPSQYT